MNEIDLSIISPVYKAENILDKLISEIISNVKNVTSNFEIILVDDGSPDKSWEVIERICFDHKFIRGVKLSRNFGQHYAITAGLEIANGKCIVIMDCDMQDNPAHIELLYKKFLEGYDTVFTKRLKRKHSFFKYVTAKLYNFIFSLFSDRNYDLNVGSLVLFSKKVRLEFLKIKDKDRLYIQVLKWLGFNQTYVEVEHRSRLEGKSTYSFINLIKIAIAGLTSHSDKLLRLSIYLGLFISILSFMAIVYIIIAYFYHGFQSGWTSLTVLILFSTGLILISIGILGLYLAKTFEQTKDRPLYIIEKKINAQ